MRAIVIMLLCSCCFYLQAQQHFAGNWSGKLQVNVPLRLVLHIKDGTGGTYVTMDSPDQNAFGIKSDTAITAGDSIAVRFSRLKAIYKGKLVTPNDGAMQLNGTWNQGEYQFPLQLVKASETSLKDERPQHPRPPFSYISEDVVYANKNKTVTLGATLTVPNDGRKHPAVVLITGSGQQDRDETVFGHKPFWVIADYFTRNGFAVLRVDDRGVGKSTGEINNATSADFAQDVAASLDYLSARKEIDVQRIGLLGHSEGGMIAPVVAAQWPISFMILLAAPAVKGGEVLDEQRAAILKANGVPKSVSEELQALSLTLNKIVIDSETKEIATTKSKEALTSWMKTASESARSVVGIASINDASAYAVRSVNQMYVPWFKYFLQYDPASELKKSSCPVLAVYAGKDIQVLAHQNRDPMEKILKQSRQPGKYKVVEVSGVNHLFQTCVSCTLEEYATLSETFSEDVMKMMVEWMNSLR